MPMKKGCKILAIILAVLMLTAMASACKKEQETDWEEEIDQDAFGQIGQPEDSDQNSEEKEDPSSEKDEDENKDESKDESEENPLKDSLDKEPSKESVSDEKDPADDEKTDEYDKVVNDYTEDKKYSVEFNPLLAESKPVNRGVLPSYSIDSTGFVKNDIKLADLKGKTLTVVGGTTNGAFLYNDENGQLIREWDWYDMLKTELGLQIKFTQSHWHSSIKQCLVYMNAGKALDVIPTSIGGFPQFLNLSQPLDPYVNLQNLGNSPGVDQMTLEETYYGGGYRCISPIGSVIILLYNQSLVEELGLKDPHTLWQNDEWDWNAWRSFLASVPSMTNDGKKLYAYRQGVGDWYMDWPMTNGVQPVALDHNGKTPGLINNWMDERVIEAVTFFADTMKSVQDASTSEDGETLDTRESYHRLFSDGTLVMASRVWPMDDSDKYPYASSRKYNWVPFPKAPNEGGRYVAYNIGYTMMVPRMVKNKGNIPYAVKFMELWANRCTEAMMDYMMEKPHFNFDYKARKEYFEFCIKNTYFGCEMSNGRLFSGAAQEAFRDSKEGYIFAAYNSNINMATKHKEVANYIETAIQDCLNYGS